MYVYIYLIWTYFETNMTKLPGSVYLRLLLSSLLPTPFFLCYSAVAEVSRIAEASYFQWRLQTGWIESGSYSGGGQSCVTEIK